MRRATFLMIRLSSTIRQVLAFNLGSPPQHFRAACFTHHCYRAVNEALGKAIKAATTCSEPSELLTKTRLDGDSAFLCDDHQLAAELQAVHGAPYAIINNVGITRDALMLHMSAQHWGEVIRNNLDSAYYATRAFTTGMIERGDGCIVNMSSVTGIKGNPGQANYAATKAALIGMTRSLAVELGRFNIRVNSVAPGIIATEMTASLTDQQVRKIASQVPLRRLGRVDEIAATVTFLLSRGSCYTTGQTFVVDGGLSA